MGQQYPVADLYLFKRNGVVRCSALACHYRFALVLAAQYFTVEKYYKFLAYNGVIDYNIIRTAAQYFGHPCRTGTVLITALKHALAVIYIAVSGI